MLLLVDAVLTVEQERALRSAAASLPDGWRIFVYGTNVRGQSGIEIRIVGPTFATVCGFTSDAHPLVLAHFLDLTKDDRTRPK